MKYRIKGGDQIDVFRAVISIPIELLMEAESARSAIAIETVKAAEEMIAAFELGRDQIEPVEADIN